MPNFHKAGLLVALFTIAGCSVQYQCKLGEECYNTEDAYYAAVNGGGNSETVMPYGPVKSEGKKDKSNGYHEGNWKPYSGSKLTDQPVYQPAQPRRIWIAPWRKGGILRAGQFIYALQPGYWNMGEMTDGGKAHNLLAPIHPAGDKPQRVQPKDTLIPEVKR